MPHLLLYLAAAVFGLVIGSFLNVLVLRDERRKTILTGRSECMHCGHPLAWYELIPLVSYVAQLGRCRACKKKLSVQYPLGEAASALLAIAAVWYGYIQNDSIALAVGVYLSLALFLVMSGTDFRTMEIRPEYAVLAAIIGGGAQGLTGTVLWVDLLLGLVIGGGTIAIFAYGWKLFMGRMGMGEGDIWIGAAVGSLVGYPNILVALFFAVGIGALVGVALTARSKKGLDVEMPFGPYLALGGVLALLWGQRILDWYIL